MLDFVYIVIKSISHIHNEAKKLFFWFLDEKSEEKPANYIEIDFLWIYIIIKLILVGRSGWSEPDAVLYQSFDSPDGLVLMEGSEPMSPVPLVPGLVTSVF